MAPPSVSGGCQKNQGDEKANVPPKFKIDIKEKFLIKVQAGKKAGWLVLSGGRAVPAPF